MNKTGKIILSALLICFFILLICGIYFSIATPNANWVSTRYELAGYTCAKIDLPHGYSIRTYSKDGADVLVIWYGNSELAQKSLISAKKFAGDRFVVLRGNALAIGYEKDIKIFQYA